MYNLKYITPISFYILSLPFAPLTLLYPTFTFLHDGLKTTQGAESRGSRTGSFVLSWLGNKTLPYLVPTFLCSITNQMILYVSLRKTLRLNSNSLLLGTVDHHRYQSV